MKILFIECISPQIPLISLNKLLNYCLSPSSPLLLLSAPRDLQMTTHKEEEAQMQVLAHGGDAATVLYDPGGWT